MAMASALQESIEEVHLCLFSACLENALQATGDCRMFATEK